MSHVSSEESASPVQSDLTTPPEAGAGELEARRQGKALAHPHVEDGAWSTFKNTTSPTPPGSECRTVRMNN